jgi:hypothetical protein
VAFDSNAALNFITMTLEQLKPLVKGITKKEIALQLDKKSPLFNYSVESGLSSYHNYTRDELLRHCIQFDVDPIGEYHKKRSY